MNAPRPIVAAGMHRSGTSLIASLLSASGVNVGEHLVGPDIVNPRGYFEDTEFLNLNRQMLLRATPEAEGHRDWGWTVCERLDRDRFIEDRAAAANLISIRQGLPGMWGWKDPRTTLTLDFWHELLLECGCDPAYVFVYRFPWDVADSMQRLGADVFLRNPEYARRIWSFYNRHILSFCERHRERCLLLNSDALWQEPERARSLLSDRLRVDLPSSIDCVKDANLWRSRAGADPIVRLIAATSPECLDLLSQLDSCAELSGANLWSATAKLRLEHGSSGTPGGAVDLSVIIPCHNHGEFMIDAIASVERFLPDGSELIVVNDGSDQPRTLEVLTTIRNLGYVVVDQPQSGLAAARNRGIALARGQYILPLDADNRIRDGFAETAIRYLNDHPAVGVVYGDRYDFGKRRGPYRVANFDLDTILLENYIDACAVYRKSLWSDCGGYDTELSAWEDWEFWISASERGWTFHRLDALTFDYRVRPESLVLSTLIPEIRSRLHAHIVHKHAALFLRRMAAIALEFLDGQPPAPATPRIQRLIAACETTLLDLQADGAQWKERVAAAEQGMLQLDLRLREMELNRHQSAQRGFEREERFRSEIDRLTSTVIRLKEREEELESVRASATWRWSRTILRNKLVRWLFGPIIGLIAERSQRTRDRHQITGI